MLAVEGEPTPLGPAPRPGTVTLRPRGAALLALSHGHPGAGLAPGRRHIAVTDPGHVTTLWRRSTRSATSRSASTSTGSLDLLLRERFRQIRRRVSPGPALRRTVSRGGCLSGTFRDGLFEDVDPFDQEVMGYHERWEKADHVAVGATGEDDDATGVTGPGDPAGQFGVWALGFGPYDLDGEHRAAAPDDSDHRMEFLHPAQPGQDQVADVPGGGAEVVLAHGADGRECGGTGD